ncbi:MAG: M23 family metallopeptidase [Pseudolysinimonas sp.]|uniref:M23 family metallopeptidase n=1 Tax=Pseudolysinimonas sp. TaxID=2680009 RepID=UPI003266A810
MTASEEGENEQSVLNILGFGTPAALESTSSTWSLERSEESADSSAAPALPPAPAPATRREARERERAADPSPAPSAPAAVARRSEPTPPSKGRGTPRRTAKKTSRRDVVRAAATPKKTIGARLLSLGAMLFAGALAIGMSVPANAFSQGSDKTELATSLAMPAQSVEVDNSLVSFSARDTWGVTSWAEMLRLKYGTRDFSYNVGTGAIRWPFPRPVPIVSGFGARAAPCKGCSTFHTGLDLGGGNGSAIFAIADGVVVEHDDGRSSWGNFVYIQHEIDGQVVFSGYAHMQRGSSPLNVGDVIKVGDFIGLVGATGEATGPHLHFTISLDTKLHYVDPFAWMQAHAG